MPIPELSSSKSNTSQLSSSSEKFIEYNSQNMLEYQFQRGQSMININFYQIYNDKERELSQMRLNSIYENNSRKNSQQIRQYFNKDQNTSPIIHLSGSNQQFKVSEIKPYKNINCETKNIPKNYGKQFIKFIDKNEYLIKRILSKMHRYRTISIYEQLSKQLHIRKQKLTNIEDLRSLWTQQNKFHTEMRIISNLFLRKFCHEWIFNSKIKDFACHIKYRAVLLQLIRSPDNFRRLKRNY